MADRQPIHIDCIDCILTNGTSPKYNATNNKYKLIVHHVILMKSVNKSYDIQDVIDNVRLKLAVLFSFNPHRSRRKI